MSSKQGFILLTIISTFWVFGLGLRYIQTRKSILKESSLQEHQDRLESLNLVYGLLLLVSIPLAIILISVCAWLVIIGDI